SSGVWERLERSPRVLRSAIGAVMGAVPSPLLAGAGDLFSRLRPGSSSAGLEARWMRRARLNRATTDVEVFRELVSMRGGPCRITGAVREPAQAFTDQPEGLSELDPITRLCLMDALTYLPDDIMVKVDRAAMAVS